ncbi:MAG: TAXI family TRAP transporter solute-binding subunit [Candidatus Vecturithrix sp.]|jgi:TRAP transporter TAXI family solute receptor|nr:TAXI family TRAP transporter solute-binding subunit [Candidatus Vecturithrix sp.]
MKRFVVFTAIVLVVVFSITSPLLAQKKFITLGSGSPGGVYYPLGGGMAVVIEKADIGVRCAAESTGASVENSRLVGAEETDMGMVMGSVAYKATKGEDPFEKAYPLMTLFQMYPAPEHIVVLKDSGIKSVNDMKGKKVSIDVPGSGCATMAKAILEEYGFDLEKDLTLANLSQSEMVQALKDGTIDVAFFNFAYPASAIMDLGATRDIELVPLEEEMVNKLLEKYPYYIKSVIPGGTYSDISEDILCLGDSNVMVVHQDMDERLAYNLTKTIFENVTEGQYALVNVHPIAQLFTPQNAINSPISLHPGAMKYFSEVGAQ